MIRFYNPSLSVIRTLLFCIALTSTALSVGQPKESSSDSQTKANAEPSWLGKDQSSSEPGSDLAWYDATRLLVEGCGWREDGTTFTRLPLRAKTVVTVPVWNQSRQTAGIMIRFQTDATTISAVWDSGAGMNHMALTGSCGLDLYRSTDGKWEFAGVGRPKAASTRTVAQLTTTPNPDVREYLLYLPLYSAVGELKIGIPPHSRIAPAMPIPASRKPMVFYGTSMTQGGCASRAGMSHSSIVGRWLNYEVINLGFSGSGKMELPVADLLAEIEASIYVIECLPNMTNPMVEERVVPFVQKLRQSRPNTPIVLVENPLKSSTERQNVLLKKSRDKLAESGVKNLHYIDGTPQLAGPENGTVDGVHPTDLGFLRIAEYYHPRLKAILTEH